MKLSLGKFEHGYCDGANNQPLVLNNLVVKPDPIEIHTGATIDLEVSILTLSVSTYRLLCVAQGEGGYIVPTKIFRPLKQLEG